MFELYKLQHRCRSQSNTEGQQSQMESPNPGQTPVYPSHVFLSLIPLSRACSLPIHGIISIHTWKVPRLLCLIQKELFIHYCNPHLYLPQATYIGCQKKGTSQKNNNIIATSCLGEQWIWIRIHRCSF